MLSLWGGSEKEAFDKVLAKFTADTGIQTQYETARDFLPVIRSRLAAGNPPVDGDRAAAGHRRRPRPRRLADLARRRSGMDPDAVNENYSEAWTNLTTIDDEVYGIVAKANSKSTIWYDPSQDHGRAAHRLGGAARADGEAEGRGQDPVGRRRGRRLAAHRLVREHLPLPERAGEVRPALLGRACPSTTSRSRTRWWRCYKILREENLPGGVEGALATPFVDSIGQVFGKSPKAELYYEGGFVGGHRHRPGQHRPRAGRDHRLLPVPRDQRRVRDAAARRRRRRGRVRGRTTTSKELMEFLASEEARHGVGLDRRDRVAEQGRPARRVPERPRAQGGRAGAERRGLRVRRLRPPARRARHRVAERPPGDHEGPRAAWTRALEDFQSPGARRSSRSQ